MIKKGSWKVHSESDPRWNNNGRDYGSVFCVPAMDKWIEHCKKEFGEPPKDATMEFWKD